ncbi:MAG: patatin-like phospholipase family protein, partial [Chloroflexota bacterium]|nr:patatin-like phospholipase family protein [Chloroflexota bacterium]
MAVSASCYISPAHLLCLLTVWPSITRLLDLTRRVRSLCPIIYRRKFRALLSGFDKLHTPRYSLNTRLRGATRGAEAVEKSDTRSLHVSRDPRAQEEEDPYLPSRDRRRGTALCLSGGGYRAALFHLGGCRRLNELGVLSGLDTISSVSGGSIFAAFLASHVWSWPQSGVKISDWEEKIAAPFRRLAARNLRTVPLLRRLLPWNWNHESVSVETLEAMLRTHVTNLRLGDLPEQPLFVFSATDMAYGVNWTFQRGRIGDYQVGYLRPAHDYPVARAVAASSCFPPFFAPLPVGIVPSDLRGGTVPRTGEREQLVRNLRLTDGGVYDNMGLEPVWKTHRTVLVSDGGATFDPQLDKGPL